MRLLHTMIRTGNLDRAVAFYTHILGMNLLRRQDYPEGKPGNYLSRFARDGFSAGETGRST